MSAPIVTPTSRPVVDELAIAGGIAGSGCKDGLRQVQYYLLSNTGKAPESYITCPLMPSTATGAQPECQAEGSSHSNGLTTRNPDDDCYQHARSRFASRATHTLLKNATNTCDACISAVGICTTRSKGKIRRHVQWQMLFTDGSGTTHNVAYRHGNYVSDWKIINNN
jgi:hypothetical protein